LPNSAPKLIQLLQGSKEGTGVTSGANHYAYDEQGRLIGEYDATGGPIQETVYLGDTPVAVLVSAQVGTEYITGVYYIRADHINAPRVITRSADNLIVWRWDTTASFGVAQPIESPAGARVFTSNQRYPGQLFDKETNNHYSYYRDYDPQTGRYIQSDPIGLDPSDSAIRAAAGRTNPIANATGAAAAAAGANEAAGDGCGRPP
jgi:RHS repeat-associated protein